MRKSAILLAVSIMLVSSTTYAEVRKLYYPNGQLKLEVNFKDDKLEGIKRYYESGKLKEEANIKDHKLEGIGKAYYKSGQLKFKGNYKDGKLHGLTKEYQPKGNVLYIDTYKNGTKIHRKMYDERGKLEFEQDYPTE